MRRLLAAACVALALLACKASRPAGGDAAAAPATLRGEVVTFPSGSLVLHGIVYRPSGSGPFPAILYNHGSAPGMMSVGAAEALGPSFAARGWVFFMPFRRGQGLSQSAGPYIMDQINAASDDDEPATMVHLLETDHLDDQLAGLAWLRAQPYVAASRVAVGGNSFGGIETVLGVEREAYCAAVDSAGGAQSWAGAPPLQERMKRAVRAARAPIFFFQAENDYDLTPTNVLSSEMAAAGKPFVRKVYPPYGTSKQQGHTLGYFGFAVWGDDVMGFLAAHCPAT
jgi:dienelactone hydrolase